MNLETKSIPTKLLEFTRQRCIVYFCAQISQINIWGFQFQGAELIHWLNIDSQI